MLLVRNHRIEFDAAHRIDVWSGLFERVLAPRLSKIFLKLSYFQICSAAVRLNLKGIFGGFYRTHQFFHIFRVLHRSLRMSGK